MHKFFQKLSIFAAMYVLPVIVILLDLPPKKFPF